MNVTPRLAGAVSLLALVPVLAFVLGKSYIAAVALLNVLLISYSIYLFMSPTEGGHGDADHGQTA